MNHFEACRISNISDSCGHEHRTIGRATRCAKANHLTGIACYNPKFVYVRLLSGKIIYRRPEIKLEKGGVLSPSKR